MFQSLGQHQVMVVPAGSEALLRRICMYCICHGLTAKWLEFWLLDLHARLVNSQNYQHRPKTAQVSKKSHVSSVSCT